MRRNLAVAGAQAHLTIAAVIALLTITAVIARLTASSGSQACITSESRRRRSTIFHRRIEQHFDAVFHHFDLIHSIVSKFSVGRGAEKIERQRLEELREITAIVLSVIEMKFARNVFDLFGLFCCLASNVQLFEQCLDQLIFVILFILLRMELFIGNVWLITESLDLNVCIGALEIDPQFAECWQ